MTFKRIKYVRSDKKYMEAYLEPNRTSKVEFFTKIVKGLNLLTIFAKNLDVCLDCECASGPQKQKELMKHPLRFVFE